MIGNSIKREMGGRQIARRPNKKLSGNPAEDHPMEVKGQMALTSLVTRERESRVRPKMAKKNQH